MFGNTELIFGRLTAKGSTVLVNTASVRKAQEFYFGQQLSIGSSYEVHIL
jgi:hypothetical protein